MERGRNDERFGWRGRQNGYAGDRPNPRNEYSGLGAGFGAGGFNRAEWGPEEQDRDERSGQSARDTRRWGQREDPRQEGTQTGRNERYGTDDRWGEQRPSDFGAGRDDRFARDGRFHYREHGRTFDEEPLRFRGEERGYGYEGPAGAPLRYRDEQDERFARQDERFGQQDERFGQQDERFGQRDERFGQRDERFGRREGGRWGQQQYSYSPSGESGSTARLGVAGATFGGGVSDQQRSRRDETWQDRDVRRSDERGGWWQREPLCATEIMTRDPKSVTRDAAVRDVALIMRNENVGAVPVVDADGRLCGIVTDRDIVCRGLMGDRTAAELRVEDVMTDDVEAVKPDDSVHDVISVMGRKQVRRVPVVAEGGRLVGIVSIGDVASRADYDEELQDALEKISSKRSFWSRLWR